LIEIEQGVALTIWFGLLHAESLAGEIMDCKPVEHRASISLMNTFLFSATLLAVVMAGSVRAQIYADVETSMGDFTIQLHYDLAPRTVANFIRLAEGSVPWVESRTGQVVQKPYYEGVIFHRVISGFMNQTGSRKGDGSDGPGYQFQDEFSVLTHTGPYVVSMANSGPNTNGGQIFITVSTQSQLNNKHSVFGAVIDDSVGQEVCDAINAVATGAGDKPLVDVVIEKIAIRREDTAAENFDEHAQGLPDVSAPTVTIDHGGATVGLTVDTPSSSLTKYSSSFDLSAWQEGEGVYRDDTDTALSSIDISALSSGQEKLFFNVSQVTYDASLVLWPRELTGRTLTIVDSLLTSQLDPNWEFTFTSEIGGTFMNGANSGNFTAADLGVDGLGTRKLIETPVQFTYSGQQYDVGFNVRFSKDSENDDQFDGRHGGSGLLSQSGTILLSGPTSGAMTLTR
jgi:peptidyl-prolyl cis-trans isomerase A (cyclophilin A)